MPTGVNVALQLLALIAALAIRLAEPGRPVLTTIAFLLPLLVALLPLGLALRTVHRGPLPRTVAGPFAATAIALVVAALLYPELDDRGWWVPVLHAIGAPGPDQGTAYLIGNSVLATYIASLMWTLVAVEETASSSRRTTATRP